jgi:hypothetical protein
MLTSDLALKYHGRKANSENSCVVSLETSIDQVQQFIVPGEQLPVALIVLEQKLEFGQHRFGGLLDPIDDPAEWRGFASRPMGVAWHRRVVRVPAYCRRELSGRACPSAARGVPFLSG